MNPPILSIRHSHEIRQTLAQFAKRSQRPSQSTNSFLRTANHSFYKTTNLTENIIEHHLGWQNFCPNCYEKALLGEYTEEPILQKQRNLWGDENQRYTSSSVYCYRHNSSCSELPKKRHGTSMRIFKIFLKNLFQKTFFLKKNFAEKNFFLKKKFF